MKRSLNSLSLKFTVCAALLLALAGCYESKKHGDGGGGDGLGQQKNGDVNTDKPFGFVLLDIIAPNLDTYGQAKCGDVPLSLASLRAGEVEARIKTVTDVVSSRADKVHVVKTLIGANDCGDFSALYLRAHSSSGYAIPAELKDKTALHVITVVWFGEPAAQNPDPSILNENWSDVIDLANGGFGSIKTVYHFALTSPSFGYMQEWASEVDPQRSFTADVVEAPPLDGSATQALAASVTGSATKFAAWLLQIVVTP